MENNISTLNVSVNTEHLEESRRGAAKPEFEELSNNKVPSIKCDIKNFDEQSTEEVLNHVDPPLCVINAVSSLVQLKVDSNLADDQMNSSTSPLSEKNSLKESDSALQVQNHKSKISSKNIVSWEFAKSFENFEAAIRYIDDGEYWSFVQQSLGEEGLKNYYRCNLSVDPNSKCAAQMYLLFHAATGNVLMCRSFDKHTQHIEIQKRELTERVKDIIHEFLELRLSPEAIMKNLVQINDIIMPTFSQVEEYISNYSTLEHEVISNQNIDIKNAIGYQNRNKNLLVETKANDIQKETEVCPEVEPLEKKTTNTSNIQNNQQVDLEGKNKSEKEIGIQNNYQVCTEHKKIVVASKDKKKSQKRKIKTKLEKKSVDKTTTDTVPSNLLSENAKNVNLNCKEKKKPQGKRQLLYLSDDISAPPGKQPRRGQRRKWILFKEFDSEAAAMSYINKEKCWGYNQQQTRMHGVKKYFRCNQVPQKGPRCPAACNIFIHKPSDKVLLYYTPYEHDHNQNVNKIVSKNPDLNLNIEDEIKKLHALGLRPESIMEHLGKLDNVEMPTNSELRSYLNYLDTQHGSNGKTKDHSTNSEELQQVQSDNIKYYSKNPDENMISVTTVVIKQEPINIDEH